MEQDVIFYIVDSSHQIPNYILEDERTFFVRKRNKPSHVLYSKISKLSFGLHLPLIDDFMILINPEPEALTFLALLGVSVVLEKNELYIDLLQKIYQYGAVKNPY